MDNKFIEHFGASSDPRVNRTKKHMLTDIIAIVLCAILTGAENWQEMEDFGRTHYTWMGEFLFFNQRSTIALHHKKSLFND